MAWLVENDYLYIDKTRYLFDLIDRGKVYFMSRPRRFGKSLTISTLYYLFKGEKDLFKDTWIYDKIDWEPRPVIKISMSELDTKDEKTFEDGLKFKLKKLYQLHGLQVQTDNIKYLFSDLIETLGKEKRVVILIDEYDKPILDHLHEPDKAGAIRERLRTFYSTLKDSDPYLEFVMLTGISKFTGCLLQQTPGNSSSKFQKTGVFSTLNNLDDISIKKRYANMLGYTQEELKVYFHAYTFQNYWVESGSPSFIVEYAKRHDIRVDRIIGEYIRESILTTYEIEAAPPVSFLIQAGYLTFKDHDEEPGYLIDYPNKEVRDSFSQLLLVSEFNLKDQDANDIRINVLKALKTRDFEKLYLQMKRTLSNIPYSLFEPKSEYETERDFIQRREGFYHSIILTMLWAAGINVRAEELSNLGRSDLIMAYEQDTYIMELKKQPARRSLEQIKEKNYAGRYSDPLFFVGIEIDDEKRNLGEYLIERKG